MKQTFTSPPITADSCTFYQSWLQGAGCLPGLTPVILAAGPNRSLWAAAVDLRIEHWIMRRILNYQPPSHFFYACRIYVNLEVLLAVCPRGPLARRAREISHHCSWQPHPINFNN